MVTKNTNFEFYIMTEIESDSYTRLLPDRYKEQDLFICDVQDAILKDMFAHMEHPFYTLSKKPDIEIRRYEHNGNWVEITPSVKGIATIYDKDIIVYCISQIMAKLKKGEPIISPRVRITTHDLLTFTNRGTSGREYLALAEALDRLAGTRIKTNIKTGGFEQIKNFGLINEFEVHRKNDSRDGRMLWCEIVLSDWVFNAIREKEVLTLNRDYFRLAKPLERRVYELARKHCGIQPKWSISLEILLKKSGSQSPLKRFRQLIKELVKFDHLPDYEVRMDSTDIVHFYTRKSMSNAYDPSPQLSFLPNYPVLQPDTYNKARSAAPGYDIHYLEKEWHNFWEKSGKKVLSNPDVAFIGFCKKRYHNNPNP